MYILTINVQSICLFLHTEALNQRYNINKYKRKRVRTVNVYYTKKEGGEIEGHLLFFFVTINMFFSQRLILIYDRDIHQN
jgi:hypothetical protein